MLIEEEGNIVTDSKYEIFCHQVNCQGVMGAGLAKQIRNRYPSVYEDYMRAIKSGYLLLGTKICTLTADKRICVSMFAQEDYGTNKCYTDYSAFQIILDGLADELQTLEEGRNTHINIAFPYKIGCGLAGGNWNIVRRMIEKFSERIPNDVYIVHLPNT